MSGNESNARPTCTWVPVTDESGRTHLEAHWGTPTAAQTRAA